MWLRYFTDLQFRESTFIMPRGGIKILRGGTKIFSAIKGGGLWKFCRNKSVAMYSISHPNNLQGVCRIIILHYPPCWVQRFSDQCQRSFNSWRLNACTAWVQATTSAKQETPRSRVQILYTVQYITRKALNSVISFCFSIKFANTLNNWYYILKALDKPSLTLLFSNRMWYI